MKKATVRLRALLIAAPLLLGAAACQSGGADKTAEPKAEPVYSKPLPAQFSAALKATDEAGSARFTSSLVYTTGSGSRAVDTTTGSQDYARHTAQAERTLIVPRTLPAKDAAYLREEGDSRPRTYAVDHSDVLYKSRSGDWLRYRAGADTEFSEGAQEMFDRAGNAAPYGGTLAELVRYTIPRHQPQQLDSGVRRYREMVTARLALELLPPLMSADASGGFSPDEANIPLTAEFDAQGRLTKASADLAPFLKELHANHHLSAVKSLRAEYALTGFGEKVPYTIASGENVLAAQKELAAIESVKPGSCASEDTGMPSSSLVRPVSCTAPHDLQVFGQVHIEAHAKDTLSDDVGDSLAHDKCDRKFQAAPAAWTRDAHPRGTYTVSGAAGLSVTPGEGTSLDGDFSCYITTS
ncbi:hypothetical protein [Streptomyces sp. NPDC050738]|uniref:hypothetical protein n=1 Tax=Streptomyces sp. NPDC050738 TaxID=3154744 RepID=UPI00343DD2EF